MKFKYLSVQVSNSEDSNVEASREERFVEPEACDLPIKHVGVEKRQNT